ncbi:acetyltransferase [Flavobacterium album]|uniref:Acetyltransferase n=1 Tax=Flavobacterium album TaxID=2175091 RepID=A0A2S1R1Y7_9FLAO|nr:acyltransferase [Flavobacterium album]AWH86733.1 acetyltransferase [Flavobacterium album]
MGIVDRLKFYFASLRVWKYKLLSDCKATEGTPRLYHPLLLKGKGKIVFGNDVQIGVVNSPNYFSHYTYVEARNSASQIIIGNNVAINNGFSMVAMKKIVIEDNVLIGVNCYITDTDSHHLDPLRRNEANPPVKEVHIMKNVFLGSNVIVLKGVTIGENSVIGNSSVVTKDIPPNVIAAGNPARVIKPLALKH